MRFQVSLEKFSSALYGFLDGHLGGFTGHSVADLDLAFGEAAPNDKTVGNAE